MAMEHSKTLIILILMFSTQPVLSIQCQDGDTRSGYPSPIVNGFEQCIEQTQFCFNGFWNGPELYSYCDNPTESCDTAPHGSVEFGFTSLSAPCFKASRTCIDGVWNGPELFDVCE